MTNLNHDYKARRLSPTGKILLSRIIPALKALAAGKTLLIQDTPDRIDQVRSHLYTYLSETSQKSYFRTVRESATSLRIICQDLTLPSLTVDFSPIETFVLENLLACENLDEASAIARSALTAGEITEEELLLIIEEWESWVGQASHSRGTTTYQSQGPPRNQGLVEKPSSDPLNGTIKTPKEKGGSNE